MVALTLRLIASLAIVVGLLMLAVWVGRKRYGGSRGRAIDVLHRQQLGRNSTVSVVNVGPRTLVLGTTDQHVTMLTELDGDEARSLSPDADSPITADVEVTPDLVSAPVPRSSHPRPTSGTLPSHEEFAVSSNDQPAAQSGNALPLDPELRAQLIAALLESPAQPQPAQQMPPVAPQPVQPVQYVQPQPVYAAVQPMLQPLPQALPPGYGAGYGATPPMSAPVAQLLGQVVQSYLMGGYAAPAYAGQPAQYAQPMLQLPAPYVVQNYPAQSYPAQGYPAQAYPAQSYPAASYPVAEPVASQPQQAPAAAPTTQPDPAAEQARLDDVMQQVMQVVEQRISEAQLAADPALQDTPRRARGAGAAMGYLGASARKAPTRDEISAASPQTPPTQAAPTQAAPSPEVATASAPAQAAPAAAAYPSQSPDPGAWLQSATVADRPGLGDDPRQAAVPHPEQTPESPAATLAAELGDLDTAPAAGFEPWRPPSAGSHAARSLISTGAKSQPTTEEAAEGLSADQLREVIAALRSKAGTAAADVTTPGRRIATDRAVDSASEVAPHAPKRAATLRAVPSVPTEADPADPAGHEFAAALEDALDSTDRVDLTLTAQGRATTVQAPQTPSPSSQGPLDGSVLSPATWKQAFNAVRVR